MSNVSRGARHERAVADYLRLHGWSVERGFKRMAFVRGKMLAIGFDLFGAFGLLAVKPGRNGPIRLIQVHAGTNVSVRRGKAFAAWEQGEVWENQGRGVYRVHRSESETELVDTRIPHSAEKETGGT